MTDPGQHRIESFAFVISICAAFVFSCIFVSKLPGFEPAGKDHEIRIDNRINPNNASVASMARLPGIGPVRAEAIIKYRDNFWKKGGENQPFRCPDDLQKVSRIGPKTAQNISGWLKFE
jgi:competence ComEA-like helix-hairpin-helix protein